MKTCNAVGLCCFRYFGDNGYYDACSYEGYCDYQLPKDSRVWSYTPPEEKCNCGQTRTEVCPQHPVVEE